jgi:glycine betaine catabolism A
MFEEGSTMNLSTSSLEALIAGCEPGWSLPRAFYIDEAVYRRDIERIWRRGWLFAGHTCEIAEPGDYFIVEVDTDSVLIIRGDDGEIRGLHNVCRHRGSMLCAEPSGRLGKIVCPYHQWVYARDGRLLACRGMPDDLDKAQFGLIPVPVRELEGLIYFSLAIDPPHFEEAHALMSPAVRPQGLERAKVARAIDYEIHANWKLVWENNRECYHCNVNHPQYIKANFDHYNADDTNERIRKEIAAAVARSEQKWAQRGTSAGGGLAVTHKQTGMTLFPDAERNLWYSVNRTPLVDGYISESMDGRQIAPLMGDYTDPDVGTLRMRTVPNFWNHSSCDHSVTTRLLPAGPRRTRARVLWLVDREAVEGQDYTLDALLPFWQLTSEQDWQICENQQRGVESSAYRPGPYSPYKEYNVDRFVQWYLKQVREA